MFMCLFLFTGREKQNFLVAEARGVLDQMSTAVAGLVLRGISRPRV